MPSLLPHVDPHGLLEYSVVFTDRALNHMSARFQAVMRGLSQRLREVYGAEAVALIPGGGSYAMEAVARQLSGEGAPLIIRNGWFSFRWTQIFEAVGSVEPVVLQARPTSGGGRAPFSPAPLAEILAEIRQRRPPVVFAAHVETAAGMQLPDDWLRAIGEACREVDALFVLDCVASGALWVHMGELGVDALISAPQKGWSGPASAGVVALSSRALARLETAPASSFVLDLRRWLAIMRAYEAGGHAYHATMPTDALAAFHEAIEETADLGFETARAAQVALGEGVREVLARYGCLSVAAPGFEAPGVVVTFVPPGTPDIVAKLAAAGVQVAGGVPLRCGEGDDFHTFRVGLFGLDKLKDVAGAVGRFEAALRDAVEVSD